MSMRICHPVYNLILNQNKKQRQVFFVVTGGSVEDVGIDAIYMLYCGSVNLINYLVTAIVLTSSHKTFIFYVFYTT